MIKSTDITMGDLLALLNALPEHHRRFLVPQNIDELYNSMDFLPKNLAENGKILKLTIHDYLGRSAPININGKDLSGLCIAYLFSLDNGATVATHEHKDTGMPTDCIEIYLPITPRITTLSGDPLPQTPCLLGQSHNIGPMPKHSLIMTIKADRYHTKMIGVDSPYPRQTEIPGIELC